MLAINPVVTGLGSHRCLMSAPLKTGHPPTADGLGIRRMEGGDRHEA